VSSFGEWPWFLKVETERRGKDRQADRQTDKHTGEANRAKQSKDQHVMEGQHTTTARHEKLKASQPYGDIGFPGTAMDGISLGHTARQNLDNNNNNNNE